ncbi:hypothetical protein ACCT30_39545, partial [Rhizobium ruizarguesonis]
MVTGTTKRPDKRPEGGIEFDAGATVGSSRPADAAAKSWVARISTLPLPKAASFEPSSISRYVSSFDDTALKATAAGQNVRLKAADTLAFDRPETQVNVQVNNTVNVTPGYVIRIGGSKGRSPPAIDAT